MRHYQRRLPHWDTVDQPLFVTFRLHGSLPAHRVFPPDSLSRSGKAFVAMDRLLDLGASGPLYLRRPEIAEFRRDAQSRSSSGYAEGCGKPMVSPSQKDSPVIEPMSYSAFMGKPFGRTKATITWYDPKVSLTGFGVISKKTRCPGVW